MAFDLTSLEVAAAISVVGIATFAARLYFDARDAWWKRVEWALDKSVSSSEAEKLVGIAALDVLVTQPLLMRRGDKKLLRAALASVFDETAAVDETLG